MTPVDWRADGCGAAKDYGNVANGKREWPPLVDFLELCTLLIPTFLHKTSHQAGT